jgi:hypothetical protein
MPQHRAWTILTLFLLWLSDSALAAIQITYPPEAHYQTTVRKRVYYKTQTDAAGKKTPTAVYTTYSHLAGDNGAKARVGHYSSFGPNGVIVTTGIAYDYWVEQSYYIFSVSSPPHALPSPTNYLILDTSHYFGETDTVEVNLIQLPWNVFQFYDLGRSGNPEAEIVRIISQADPQPAAAGENKAVVVASAKVGKADNSRFAIPLTNLTVIRDLNNNPASYSYGLFALRVNDGLDFSQCGGVAGYSLTEDPVSFNLSLTDRNGNPVSGFNSGVVLNLCVNGWTTPGYGFRVEKMTFDTQLAPSVENPACDLGTLNGHNSASNRFCGVNEKVRFYACQGNYSVVYVRERLAVLGGTPASYWTANQVRNLKYFVDWGDATARTQIGSCLFEHAYAKAGNFVVSVIADFDVNIYNAQGQLLGTEHRSNQEIRRGLVVVKPAEPVAKRALSIVSMQGDVNRDSSVDVLDVLAIAARTRKPPVDWLAFDVNGDGQLNVADARKVVTLFTNPKGKVSAPAFPLSASERYAAALVQTGTGRHYEVRARASATALFTTRAQFTSLNDAKAGLFSRDGKRFAAIYHYGHAGPETWLGLWEVPTGRFLGARLMPGYLTSVPRSFSTEGLAFE